VTRLDTKGRSLKFKESWRVLFKWINSLEQYNNKGKCHKKDPVTVQVNYNSLEQCKHKEKNACNGWRETDLETKKLQQRWRRAGWSVRVRLFQLFSFCSLLASVSCVQLRVFVPFSLLVLASVLFFSADLVAGNGAETERQSLLVLAFDNLKKT